MRRNATAGARLPGVLGMVPGQQGQKLGSERDSQATPLMVDALNAAEGRHVAALEKLIAQAKGSPAAVPPQQIERVLTTLGADLDESGSNWVG